MLTHILTNFYLHLRSRLSPWLCFSLEKELIIIKLLWVHDIRYEKENAKTQFTNTVVLSYDSFQWSSLLFWNRRESHSQRSRSHNPWQVAKWISWNNLWTYRFFLKFNFPISTTPCVYSVVFCFFLVSTALSILSHWTSQLLNCTWSSLRMSLTSQLFACWRHLIGAYTILWLNNYSSNGKSKSSINLNIPCVSFTLRFRVRRSAFLWSGHVAADSP